MSKQQLPQESMFACPAHAAPPPLPPVHQAPQQPDDELDNLIKNLGNIYLRGDGTGRDEIIALLTAWRDRSRTAREIEVAVIEAHIEEVQAAIIMAGKSMLGNGTIIDSSTFEGGQPGMVDVAILKKRLEGLKARLATIRKNYLE